MPHERSLDDLSQASRSLLAACSREGTRLAALDRCLAHARESQAFLFDVLGGELPPPSPADLAPAGVKIGDPVPSLTGYRLRVIRAFERLLDEARVAELERTAYLRSKAEQCRRLADFATDREIREALQELAGELDGHASREQSPAAQTVAQLEDEPANDNGGAS